MKRIQTEHNGLRICNVPETTDTAVFIAITPDNDSLLFVYDARLDERKKITNQSLVKWYYAEIQHLLQGFGSPKLLYSGYRPQTRQFFRGIKRAVVERCLSYTVKNLTERGSEWSEVELLNWSRTPGEESVCFWSRELQEVNLKTVSRAQQLMEAGYQRETNE